MQLVSSFLVHLALVKSIINLSNTSSDTIILQSFILYRNNLNTTLVFVHFFDCGVC